MNLQGKYDPLDAIFSMQSFDTKTNTFAGYYDGEKEVYLGAMWLSEPMVGLDEGQLLSIQSVLSSPFQKETMIQIGLLSSPDFQNTIFEYKYTKRHCSNPIISELVKRQVDLMTSGRDKPVIDASGVLLNKKRVIITLKCKFEKVLIGNIVAFNEQATKVESSLRANGLMAKRSNASEYLGICRLITHLYDPFDDRYDESMTLNEQVFYTGDEIVINKNFIEFNTGVEKTSNYFASALSPKFLPKDFSLGLMNYAIGDPKGLSNQIRLPYLMIITLNYPDQVAKKAEVNKKASWINHQLFGGSAKFMPNLGLKKEGFDILSDEIERNSAVLVEATFALWLFGRDKADLQAQNDDIRNYWSSLGFEMRADKFILDVLFSYCMPLNPTLKSGQGLFRKHTLTASQAAQFLPVIAEWKGSPQPTVLLSTRRGEVGGFDLFKSSNNFNCCLISASGAGKSFVTQRIIVDYLAEGAKVWVIDSGYSYKKLAAAQGGSFLDFQPSSDICLNPFTSYLAERGGESKNIDEEMEMICTLLERMAAQRESLDDMEIETLKKAIRQTFIEHQGYTTIQNISEWLTAQSSDPRARDLALRLDSFAFGQYARFFNGAANVNMESDFVVCELDGLKNQKTLQQVVLLQLITQVTNDMYLSNKTGETRKRLLIIDEAWSLIDDPVMGRAMETAFRVARKFNSSIFLVTQGIGDMYKSSAGQTMIENSSWQIILQQKVEAIESVRNAGQLTLDQYSYEMLKTVQTVPGQYSEMMIINNGAAGIFRLTVDRFTQIMFSTTGAERAKILQDIDDGVDVIESIQNYIVGDDSFQRFTEIRHLMNEMLSQGKHKSEVSKMLKMAITEVDLME
ncbi:type IV secretion system protein TraC [Rhodoferax antarcticus]|uniref:Type-IV secretion system protein TraC n=1 Tax=Rhodoferax antarcticus ANT.BR TaxID=1111071 RepID=A0A1Q8Y967_9BURK|nr:type IV secretion system protein TraC [Rhodoferax antarcticus]OLP04477.1 type-IV secretion system protein TraC [Rhodoferax antarcticus ANT.BR]